MCHSSAEEFPLLFTSYCLNKKLEHSDMERYSYTVRNKMILQTLSYLRETI